MVHIAPQFADLPRKKYKLYCGSIRSRFTNSILAEIKHGYADFAESQDSDLLAYGCEKLSY